MVGAGKAEGAIDAGNMLKPALARGELHCIGATTLDEYRKYIEKDAALERRFQKILVGEPSVEATIAILRGLQEKYEVAPRRRDHRPGDRRRGRAQPPLHHRPLPARQGDRPDRRGGVEGQDRDRLQARGDRQARPPPDPAADRARRGASRRRTRRRKRRRDLIEEEIERVQREIADLEEIWKAEKAAAQGSAQMLEEIDRIALPDRGAEAQGRLQQGRRAAVRQAARARAKAQGSAGDGAEEGRRRRPAAAAAHDGRRRGDRRGRRARDRHPGLQADAGRARQAAADGSEAARARRRPGRGDHRGRQRDPPLALGPVGSEPADRLVPVPRARPASARPSCARRSPASCSTARTT